MARRLSGGSDSRDAGIATPRHDLRQFPKCPSSSPPLALEVFSIGILRLLPCCSRATIQGTNFRSHAPAMDPVVILLVEDDLGVQSFIWRLLKADGFRVLTAGDGEAALDVSRNCCRRSLASGRAKIEFNWQRIEIGESCVKARKCVPLCPPVRLFSPFWLDSHR